MTASSFNAVTGAPEFADGDAPDVAVNPTEVAAFAGEVGNRIVRDNAGMLAYAYAHEGLSCYNTTDEATYVHDGTNWVKRFWDTGWVTISTYSAGMSAYLDGSRYRVINGVVHLVLSVQGTIPTGGYTALFPTPSDIQPDYAIRFGGIGSSGHPVGFSWESGTVSVGHFSGSSRAWVAGSASVPAGTPYFS